MLGYRHLVVFILCLTVAGGAAALVAPKDGTKLPEPIRQLYNEDGRGYVMTGGWSQKVKTLKERREAYLAANGPQALSSIPAEFAVAGTMEIPVLLTAFANVPGPFDSVAVQTKLFGPGPGTVTDYYDEVSYGQLNMTGTVYDWAPLSQNDAFYEGLPPDCNGLCSTGNMFQLLQETLDLKDPVVDFARYDNDGPDGVPNSGDDDGYVDFVAFVHSEYGGECGGNNNVWSHQYYYAGWDPSGLPYVTTDAAYGGGFIRVNEYTMQPVAGCPPDNNAINEIGVFCHEFGHAFGLPDLYDFNGQGSGIGHWGIMGSGNWNQPDSPAHPCAWTRWQLGWITPTVVTWQESIESINAIATSGEALLLDFTYNRFKRSNDCKINGAFSMYCGLDTNEGVARGWDAHAIDRGYGNTWNETIEREFEFDGTTPVNMSYVYRYDTESAYDFCYTIVEVGGVENVLDEFTGSAPNDTAYHDITTYVSGLPPGGKYRIKFRGVSDPSWADEDGNFNSNCGMFVVDDVTVTGGGENHLADFEGTDDGWYQSISSNPPREYWLVENRQVFGYDAHLHGTGLIVMHVDEPIIESPFLGNSGGSSHGTVKGVVMEEADGQDQLDKGLNRGDGGDVYPGTTNNRTFNLGSYPSSLSNSWTDTEITITGISDSGDPMVATIRAGDPGPVVTNSVPGVVDNDVTEASVAITGDNIRPEATFLFRLATVARVSGPSRAPADSQDIPATSIRWNDPTMTGGTINVYSKTGGDWDLIVTNPDGQSYTYPAALTINPVVAAQLQSASIQVAGQAIRLEYRLFDTEADESIRLSRSRDSESAYAVIERDLEADDAGLHVYLDSDVEPGTKYYYKLDVVSAGGEIRELHRGSAAVPAGEMKLSQNFPNPFNPVTSISFYLPKRLKVRLEVFDVAGRLVTRLDEGVYEAGPHKLEWNGVDSGGAPASSGVYIYRLTAGNRAISKKMILLK